MKSFMSMALSQVKIYFLFSTFDYTYMCNYKLNQTQLHIVEYIYKFCINHSLVETFIFSINGWVSLLSEFSYHPKSHVELGEKNRTLSFK